MRMRVSPLFSSLLTALVALVMAVGCGDVDDGDDILPADVGARDTGAVDAGVDAAPAEDAGDGEDAAPQPDAADGEDAAPQPDAGDGEDAAPQPDAGDGEGLVSGVGGDRGLDTLSDAERNQVCGAISNFLSTELETTNRVEAGCYADAISFASFTVVGGSLGGTTEELQSTCREAFQQCTDDPPQDIVDPDLSIPPENCTVVQNCTAPVGLLEECFEGLVESINQQNANTATCDDIVFNEFGQVVVLNQFQPDPTLLAACEQFAQSCSLSVN